MSDNINEANNICVPEDAFEKFQADNVCEEDDFITLADIMPSQPPTRDVIVDLDEIQDDISIVDEPEQQIHDGNITILPSSSTNPDHEIHSDTTSTIDDIQFVPNEPLQPTSVTRSGENEEKVEINLNTSLIQTNSDEQQCFTGVSDKDSVDQTPSSVVTSSRAPKRAQKRRSGLEFSFDGESNESLVFNESSQSCKRGRPKRTNTINCQLQSSLDMNDTLKKKGRHRKQKSKAQNSSHNETKDSQIVTNVSNSEKVCDTSSTDDKSLKQTVEESVNPSTQPAREINSSESLTVKSEEKELNNSLESASNCVNVTSTKKPRRPRQKKSFYTYEPIYPSEDQNSSQKPEGHAHESSSQVKDTPDEVTKPAAKRGRAKSMANNDQRINHFDHDYVHSSNQSTEGDLVKKKGKRGRKTKSNCELTTSSKSDGTNDVKDQEAVEKKYDEVELELIRILSTPTNDLDENIEKKQAENNQNPPKRRGRKPKKQPSIDNNMEQSQDKKEIVPDDDADDICLSSLKKQLKPSEECPVDENNVIREEANEAILKDNDMNKTEKVDDTPNNENVDQPSSIVTDQNTDNINDLSNILDENVTNDNESESPSKRPVRRKAKKILHYDEGSDEDPFANVELSDDDLSGRKAGRYYSDDEYIPGKRKKGKSFIQTSSSEEESEDLDKEDELIFKKQEKKKKGKKTDESPIKSPHKKRRQSNINHDAVPDITSTAADTTTQIDEQVPQSPDAFDNIIVKKILGGNIQIKKVSAAAPNQSTLEIPVLDPNEPKKIVEVFTQTTKAKTKSVEVQTTAPYEGTMKNKVPLNLQQSEKACQFLQGIVKTTSDLGQLMIQKSEDFIQKKINTENITDTTKLDYCVKKSFLLFKLARHNLVQMEEDLANEYEQFLQSNNMSQYRDVPKSISATPKQSNSDSDCEIIEEPVMQKEKEKPKFNLKTVFLNKELSIKMAKPQKSFEQPLTKKNLTENVNVQGRHTVWINDSIMVKKVKPTHSFLAQDGRNKKPPDSYITVEAVQQFFDNYYKKQQVLKTCAPFISPEWLNVRQTDVCYYFIDQINDLSTHSPVLLSSQVEVDTSGNASNNKLIVDCQTQPLKLKTLCFKVLQKCMFATRIDTHDHLNVDDKYISLYDETHYQPETLFGLSFNVISKLLTEDNKAHQKVSKNKAITRNISSLQIMCLSAINNLFFNPPCTNADNNVPQKIMVKEIHEYKSAFMPALTTPKKQLKRNFKTLFSLCFDILQKTDLCLQNINNYDINENNIIFTAIKPLKCLAYEAIKLNLYNDTDDEKVVDIIPEQPELSITAVQSVDETDDTITLTIESVNTLSDDIFSKIPETAVFVEPPILENDDSNFSNYDEFEHDYEESNDADNLPEESNWVSKVQLQELKSCFLPVDDNVSKPPVIADDSNKEYAIAQIKIEPMEEIPENQVTPVIKREPVESVDDTVNFTPLITKLENAGNLEDNEGIPDKDNHSYDEDAFESFARTSKMLHDATDYSLSNEEIFSQSALRVRRQYEPDFDDDIDTSMSLLVPQDNIEQAKDRLMESSSDDENGGQKNAAKKKRRGRPKGAKGKVKDVVTNKDKQTLNNEVALLTKKMQDKIRQEEKKDESSDSELENSLALRRENSKKAVDKTKSKPSNQIQCNDVDSTENLNDSAKNNLNKEENKKKPARTSLRNKAKEDQLEESNESKDQGESFVMQADEPVELLECEPTLPMMHDDVETVDKECPIDQETVPSQIKEPEPEEPEQTYIDRHGWKCFPVNTDDTKLYEHTYILLEKLPESFVETYFRYQGMTDKDQDDTDVDRLTNLQSLHRNVSRDSKGKSKSKTANGHLKKKETDSSSRPSSPANNDDCDEFSPSEDEEANIDDETAPPAPHQDAVENAMAKDWLMNDGEGDSDSEKPSKAVEKASEDGGAVKIKKEVTDEPSDKPRRRPGPKSRCKEIKEIDSLMLTADKMMNKELALLHAPVSLNVENQDVKDVQKKPPTKNKSTSKLKEHLERTKNEEDSSSEEEKQWVNTKEKLLKRLEKKQGNPSVDDAKRAKIVSEFIERRGEAPEKRPRGRCRSRRSGKKFLERQKQMSVLNKELFGEVDTTLAGRKHSNVLGKGRKNIRKVIDKKSLARSTVIANMEEFERKRRLNMQQTRLREELGCEEGVNVLVINDEVCLEYDFEEMRPVVTVHPFFTRVMKAHQYEGVKFMWDACFESIAMVESGHPGGGCILAHCMGLGKTLQVLALLHTVLTHPRVRMHRVLVCCPLSTVLNWVDEIHKWIGPVTNQIKVFELSKLKKTYERAYQLEDWYNGGGIFIIGYELFRSLTTLDAVLDDIRPTIVNKIRSALLDPGPDVVICDEGHLLKNDSSVLAVAMSRVATKRRIVLTGTPMQNNLREYYCMVNFVKPSLLGTYSEYSNRFENPIMNGQHRDSQEEDIKLMKARTHILHKVLEGCLQRQEASVLYPYLPKKHEYTVFIPPTKCQWDLYKHYIMTYAIHQQQQQNNVEKQKKQHSVLKDFHVLQKIWTHPQVLHNFLMKGRDERNKIKMEKLEDDLAQEDLAASEDVKPNQTEVWWLQYLEGGGMLDSLESSNKFMVVFQLLEECIALGDKVLIFSTSLYTMDALEYFLKHINKWSLGQEYYRLDGSVPAEVRQKWCREFNAEHNLNTKLFLISTRAGSLGLNMTAANRVIILDTSWNPAHDIQSIFRVYRFGQKKDCYIYRLVAMGTMEQKIYERAVTKQAVACRVVDEQQIDRHYNMSELTELYRFDEEGTSVEAGLAAGVADVALLRVAARARLHAVREHDSLLRGSREQHLPEHERAAAWMQFQQEHANEEMQDRLMEASRGIQHMLAPQLAMQSGLMPIKTENGMQLQVPLPVPPPPPSQGKKKRGRKPANSSPPPENIVQMAQAVTEDAKVKMIMKLLIKHNFLDTKPASEVSQLVSNVRRIVDNKGVGLEDCDELTRSIATVMLEEEEPKQPTTPPPALTDIITGDLDSTPHQPEIKQEVPEVENQFEVPNETSLLVPVREEVRKLRGKPRKYSVQDKSKPLVPRGRGRPRKRMVSDSEEDSKGIQSSSSSSSGITSRRRRNSPRNSYVSDVEEVPSRPESCYTSKESSPIPFDEPDNPEVPIEKPFEKAKEKPATRPRPKRQISSYSEQSEVSIIEDDSNPPPSKEDQSVVLDDSGTSDLEERNIRSRKGKKAPPVEVVPEPESSSTGKAKRKAALAAKQHFESLNGDDIVTLDDDDDEWVADSVDLSSSKPAFETSKDKSETTRADTKYKKSFEKRTQNSKTEKNKAKRNVSPPKEPPKNQSYLSILLSDDEDVQAVETDPKPSPKAQDTSTSEPKEEISLHPSMLSNANFIKIVAYAYQSNRMLDEDAALLAAQYSTQKALKEIETTGKSITSGPLYDIAVKVLGKDVLKKLHDKKDKDKVKKPSEVDAPSLSISVKQNGTKNELAKSKTERPKITIKAENLIKPLDLNEKQKKSGPASTTTLNKNANCSPAIPVLKNKEKPKSPNPEVVPVGMFKGIVPMNQKSDEVEECILPDDDDVIFHRSTNPIPPVSQPPPTSIYKKPNAQPFVITSVSSSKRPEPMPMPAPPRADITTPEVQQSNIAPQQPVYLTISNGKLVIPANVTKEVTPSVVPGTAPVQQPPANDTICLDSDDEDVTDVPPPPPPLQSIPLGPPPAKPLVPNQTFQPVPPAPVLQSPLQPSPVALSTNVPGANPQIIQMPVLTDVQGMPVMFRLDDAPSIVPNIDQAQQQGFIIIDPATGNLMTPDVPNSPNPPMIPTPAIPMPASAPKVAKVTEKKNVGPGIKKVCKPGDIVRITKEGSLEVLSRLDRLPSNVKAQSISSKVEKRPESKLQPPVPEKRKTTDVTPVIKTRPNATFTSKDPLSILKDVVQIRAFDEPIAKTSSKIESKSAPKQSKYVAIAPKFDSKVANKSNDNMSRAKPSDNSNLNKHKATVVQYQNDKSSSNNSSMQGNKKVISASPKDIIIRTKPSGNSLVKASASTSNVRPANVKTYTTQYKDLKKRASPWPDTSSVKKKNVNGVSRPMTLKDFNIDDIDDIIELE